LPAKRKSSPRRTAAARANGARSRGPKTPAGKRKSSRNSLKHGACSRTSILLPGEDAAKLQLLTNSFYQHFRPRDLAEGALVDTMIAQVWRTARITGYESEILTSAAEDLHQNLASQYDSITAARLFALAFQNSTDDGNTSLPARYLVSARNMFRSALSDLIRLRDFKTNPADPCLNPPEILPVISHFSVHLEDLPVSGLGSVTTQPPDTQAAPEAPPEPEYGEPEYTAPPQAEAFYQPPQPEPKPEPRPAVQPEPEPPNPLSIYPMLPMRDSKTGAIIINYAGKPIWKPNPNFVPRPGVPTPRFSFAGETFNFDLFADKPLANQMCHEGYFYDDIRMNEDLFPIEPKPPATQGRTTTSTQQHPHKPRSA